MKHGTILTTPFLLPSFLKMISTAAKGGTVVNYSSRFTLTDMTGSFPPNVITAMKTIKGTDGPDRLDTTTDAQPAEPDAEQYEMEYTMQTGAIRYAPMPDRKSVCRERVF